MFPFCLRWQYRKSRLSVVSDTQLRFKSVIRVRGFYLLGPLRTAMPAPESEIVAGELVALLVIVSAPLAFLVPAGANFIEYCVVPPGVRTQG